MINVEFEQVALGTALINLKQRVVRSPLVGPKQMAQLQREVWL